MWRTVEFWILIFDKLVIPFVGGFALTLGKTIAGGKILSFDDANDIALDMVLLGIGVIVTFVDVASTSAANQPGQAERTLHACAVDVFVAAVLLYLRYLRRKAHEDRVAAAVLAGVAYPANLPVTRFSGVVQLTLGLCAIIWGVVPF